MTDSPSVSPEDRGCPACGGAELEPGFVDPGGSTQRYTRWIAGPLRRGPLGRSARLGRRKWTVEGWRCTACDHLTLYARTLA